MDMTGKTRCAWCGEALARQMRDGIMRLVCTQCGRITYENPTVGVAAILFHPEREAILLGKRGLGETRGGDWCIPCGHTEYNEDIRQAIVREMREEIGFLIEPVCVYEAYSNFHEPAAHTVGIWFLGKVIGGICRSGDDVAQTGYFAYHELPRLAFPTDRIVLEKLHRDHLI